jgi:hypothetical protein
MSADREHARALLSGPLLDGGPWPLTLPAVLCDLRRRFLAKGTAGRGHRAVARNGRVLLCGDRPLAALDGLPTLLRLQTWHKAVLPGEPPRPYGLLLVARAQGRTPDGPSWMTRLVAMRDATGDLVLDVGVGLAVAFLPRRDSAAE